MTMAYNEKLADRTREIISQTHKKVEEKKMFGGLCFMVNDKMCVGVEKDRMMVRLDPLQFEEVIEKEIPFFSRLARLVGANSQCFISASETF